MEEKVQKRVEAGDGRHLTKTMLKTAVELSKELKASGILLYTEFLADPQEIGQWLGERSLILATRDGEVEEALQPLAKGWVRIPPFDFGRAAMTKLALLLGLSKGFIRPGDRLICLSGSFHYKTLDSIVVVDVSKELEIFSSAQLSLLEDIGRPEVFEAVLGIALELAREGREGRPVGTIFVLGDHERVLQFSRQMIINPFGGLPEEERNILDPHLKESIKEFAAIDGAFIVRDDGVILCAGRHLDAAGEDLQLPKGWGSRHLAAAGITNVTKAVAIVVSESTGAVRIFSRGKPFMEIEKEA
ncbi:MAG: hypothetical protein DRG69_03230 [Deltaproteobacteria bacterium]|nr:MAG: hypothetical protein DRG69_03230 [Deltaproteobacteria bacterium]